MDLSLLRVISVLVIAIAYMIFDVFNHRNVPEIFAYGTLAYGAALTILSLNLNSILLSFGIALVISGLGYVVYKIGQIGAADIIEFATISLIIFTAPMPILISGPQLGIPFIISVFVAAGIAAMAMVPIYYLPQAKLFSKKKSVLSYFIDKDVLKAYLIAIAYSLFIAFLIKNSLISIFGAGLLIFIMAVSVLVILYRGPITSTMVEYVPVNKFDEGDIIAINLMDDSEIAKIKRSVKSFDRLVTQKLINELKQKRINKKFPVYKKAIPLALPILIGVIITLLIGNIMLLAI